MTTLIISNEEMDDIMKIVRYQIRPKFNGIYSINNLPKIKDGHM